MEVTEEVAELATKMLKSCGKDCPGSWAVMFMNLAALAKRYPTARMTTYVTKVGIHSSTMQPSNYDLMLERIVFTEHLGDLNGTWELFPHPQVF